MARHVGIAAVFWIQRQMAREFVSLFRVLNLEQAAVGWPLWLTSSGAGGPSCRGRTVREETHFREVRVFRVAPGDLFEKGDQSAKPLLRFSPACRALRGYLNCCAVFGPRLSNEA